MQSKRGFTLIELMVVIAIIGILATIITANLSTAQAKARDARRVGDIKVIQTALALYYNDNYSYPASLNNLKPNYIAAIPLDPRTSSSYKYTVLSLNGGICNSSNPALKYHLGAALEVTSNSALTQDSDAAVDSGHVCTGAPADFSGTSPDCTNSSGTEGCYDWTP